MVPPLVFTAFVTAPSDSSAGVSADDFESSTSFGLSAASADDFASLAGGGTMGAASMSLLLVVLLLLLLVVLLSLPLYSCDKPIWGDTKRERGIGGVEKYEVKKLEV